MSIKLTEEMRLAWHTRDMARFLELLDQDYVTRWGWVKLPVPREVRGLAEYQGYIAECAKRQAEAMGATIVDIDKPIFVSEPNFTDTVIYAWKVRRD